ncbi:hypothetical protein EG68_10956 [Paragonimus skrjabini miyazakii]|uniref:Sulfotransferase n=1 Tax=Paragonimus skrjabini miyazakii TaxID=59628 RepID=A0A8S9YGZ1_9TREM|nr:hypothetical protein EG68_10956 [Paragonimus skrjabini miyazakii]
MLVEGKPRVGNSDPLLVIGAGFGRTGTMSLKTALEIIYDQPCYHMIELLTHYKDHSRKWIEVDRLVSELKDGKIDPRLFYEIFAEYRCTVDFPSCSYYPQMMQVYPEAKVVLTFRDKYSWLESVRATILPQRDFRRCDWADRMIIAYLNGYDFLTMHFTMWERTLGQNVDILNDEMVLAAYDQWIDQVKQIVPTDRLFVFQGKDGWEPLCKFLNVPVPNQPFPNVNERAEFVKRIENFQRLTRLLRWSVVLTIRDKHAWLQSVRETVLPRKDVQHPDWAERLIVSLFNGWHFTSMRRIMVERVFGQGIDTSNDEALLAGYDRWIDQVKRDVPADRLLVFQVKEGWKPLCDFLNVPVPNQPFPKVNERAELVKFLAVQWKLTRLVRWGVRFMVGLTVAFVLYRLF